MNIGICKFVDCVKKDSCKRFIEQQGELIDFKNICNEETQYKWFWQVENNTKEGEEKK